MEAFSFSTSHSQYPIPTTSTPLPILSTKPFPSTAILCLKPPPDSPDSSSSSGNHLRRPNKPLQTSPPSLPHNPSTPSNPLRKNPLNSSSHNNNPNHSLTNKLWLTSKLSPPPREEEPGSMENLEIGSSEPNDLDIDSSHSETRFRQEGKIFVGNLPNWVKKNEVTEFFRQFGPIQNVILIKGYSNAEKNAGFGFVIYAGPAADKSAMKAVEFDGVEFHGRILTVKLDNGKRLRERAEDRARWVEGDEAVDYRSKWHEERESSRKEFRKILETQPENWQAVVRSFERINKVQHLSIAL